MTLAQLKKRAEKVGQRKSEAVEQRMAVAAAKKFAQQESFGWGPYKVVKTSYPDAPQHCGYTYDINFDSPWLGQKVLQIRVYFSVGDVVGIRTKTFIREGFHRSDFYTVSEKDGQLRFLPDEEKDVCWHAQHRSNTARFNFETVAFSGSEARNVEEAVKKLVGGGYHDKRLFAEMAILELAEKVLTVQPK